MRSQLLATREIRLGHEGAPDSDESHLKILIEKMVREGKSELDIDRAVKEAVGH
jgi:stress-induced morphogen